MQYGPFVFTPPAHVITGAPGATSTPFHVVKSNGGLAGGTSRDSGAGDNRGLPGGVVRGLKGGKSSLGAHGESCSARGTPEITEEGSAAVSMDAEGGSTTATGAKTDETSGSVCMAEHA